MPLYEYHCLKCGKNFDALQKFADPPIKKHEGCGGKTERVLSAPSFQLKGSGWYATDYGKGGGNKPGEKAAGDKAESKAEAKAETATETKSETKSEAKTESKAKSKSKSSTE
jgi:putative FmdB family regulatory protein